MYFAKDLQKPDDPIAAKHNMTIRCFDFADPNGFAGDLIDVPDDRRRRFGFLGRARSIGREANTFNPLNGRAASLAGLAASRYCGIWAMATA